ncbi:MAG: serine/threonine-protein kinase, partial [Myxococcota bacterium]
MTASGESTEATQAVAVDSAVAPTHALETVGTKIGRYVVLGAAGQGGMGLVLRAYDAKLQREVALKVVRTERITPDARARMIREARAMAQLSHPNVIAIYDVEEMDRAGVVVAMEYVPGQTLREWIEGDHPWTEIVARFVAAGRGVEAAHRAGILHRDFKPANVLLGDDDRVRVMDFGLARSEQLLSDDEASDPDPERASSLEHDDPAALARELTQAGLVLGTPLYMAPEQHTGGQLTAATDQYAFCVSLWQGLAGTVPFAGKGVELLDRKLAGEPVFPKHRRAPAALIRALQRGLEPGPADRFPTMAALPDAISIDPAAKRSRRLIVASIAAVVAGVGAAATMATSQPRPCTRAEQSLGDVWSAARREATAKAFEDLAAQYAAVAWTRIAPRLDTYAADWVAEHTDACEATHV